MLVTTVLLLVAGVGERAAFASVASLTQAACSGTYPTPGKCEKVFCSADTNTWEVIGDPAKNGVSCSDGNACTYSDVCQNGACRGTSVSCTTSDPCFQISCNGSSWCALVPNPGASCTDPDLCTHGDTCDASGVCRGTPVTCQSTTCLTRTCNGTSTCTETPVAPTVTCNDGQLCTYADHCSGTGACVGTSIDCTPRGPCEPRACNGTAACVVATLAPGTACPASTNPCELVCDGTSPSCQPE